MRLFRNCFIIFRFGCFTNDCSHKKTNKTRGKKGERRGKKGGKRLGKGREKRGKKGGRGHARETGTMWQNWRFGREVVH